MNLRNKSHHKHISGIWEDGGYGHYTEQEPMYLDFLPDFKGGEVLEIGPGTGEFARLMIELFEINAYKVLDLEKNVFDSVYHVKEKTGFDLEYVFSQNYQELFSEEFELVVSNVCIPEVPKEYREDLLNNVIPNANSAMVIGQLTGDWVTGDEYEVWLKGLFDSNFERVKCELTPYCNCYALTGTKNGSS